MLGVGLKSGVRGTSLGFRVRVRLGLGPWSGCFLFFCFPFWSLVAVDHLCIVYCAGDQRMTPSINP